MPQNHSRVRYLTIDEGQAGQRIDNFLLGRLKGVPRSHVYRLLRTGQVRVNGGRIRAQQRLHAGDQVRLPPWRGADPGQPDRPPDTLVERVAAAIIYEDEDLLVINKPAGLAVHGGSGVRFGIIEALRAVYPDAITLALAHRLDRDTSGCLLVARRRETLLELHRLLRAGNADKYYLALLAGRWRGRAVEVDVPLIRDRLRGGERMVEVSATQAEGRRAVSIFRPLAPGDRASLVEVRIRTGRTHQIRVHAAHLAHPVAGDDKYGNRALNRDLRSLGLKRLFLHAARLSLPLVRADRPFTIHAPLPHELRAVLHRLGLKYDDMAA